MDPDDLARAISRADYDLEAFVRLIISDESSRDAIIDLMARHAHIMVYDHCFYIVSHACRECPRLFYPYWPVFTALLAHQNSYHRDYGLTLIAYLSGVDAENRFPPVFEDFFARLGDPKFMTAKRCIEMSKIVLRNRPEFREEILSRLLDIDRISQYTPDQKALMKCSVLDALEQEYEHLAEKTAANTMIRAEIGSSSPKTRKKARELAKKLGLLAERE